jgi:large conductance mechanosensitive channel
MAEASKERTRVIQKKEVTVVLPVVKAPAWLQGFVNFIREQGVVGLAVGLVLGVAAKSVVDSLVINIFNPIVGALLGGASLADRYICVREVAGQCVSKVGYGKLLNDIFSFIIVAAVVYFVVKGLKLDRLDKKKED